MVIPQKLTGATHGFCSRVQLRLLLWVVFRSRTAGSPEGDRAALKKTKFATRLPQWRESWLHPVDAWDGVGVNAEGRVEELVLPRKQIKCWSLCFWADARLRFERVNTAAPVGRFVLVCSRFPGSSGIDCCTFKKNLRAAYSATRRRKSGSFATLRRTAVLPSFCHFLVLVVFGRLFSWGVLPHQSAPDKRDTDRISSAECIMHKLCGSRCFATKNEKPTLNHTLLVCGAT